VFNITRSPFDPCCASLLVTLRDYILKIGAEAFAEKFGCSERAAVAYRQRTRTPRPALAQRIVKNSPVTWSGIYGEESHARESTRTARA